MCSRRQWSWQVVKIARILDDDYVSNLVTTTAYSSSLDLAMSFASSASRPSAPAAALRELEMDCLGDGELGTECQELGSCLPPMHQHGAPFSEREGATSSTGAAPAAAYHNRCTASAAAREDTDPQRYCDVDLLLGGP